MTFSIFILLASVIGFAIGLNFDLRRRKLSLRRSAGWNFGTTLDVVLVSLTIGGATALVLISSRIESNAGVSLSPATFGIISCILALLFLWPEGRRQIQLQRPSGIVFGEGLFLFGISCLIALSIFGHSAMGSSMTKALSIWLGILLPIVMSTGILFLIVPPFIKGKEEHRILNRLAQQGEFIQAEWAGPSRECPFPEKWHMLDAQSAETEVLDFLKELVIATKPDLIVETGTFIGHSAIKMASGLKQNGFGRLITIEHDPTVFSKAKENIDASGLGRWIESRNASSLESEVDGDIDILYSDSDVNIRESEVRRFLPQIKPRGLVLIHDAGSYFKVVREAALRLEEEGLLSVILLSTPRGLMVAQKREGRS
jgi:Predicted O-methyltransferase